MDHVVGYGLKKENVLINLLSGLVQLDMFRPLGLSLVILIPLIFADPSYSQGKGSLRDPVVIQVVHLDYSDAEHLSSVLSPLLSAEGRIMAYRPTNSLIIRDRRSVVKKLVKIIKGFADPQACLLSEYSKAHFDSFCSNADDQIMVTVCRSSINFCSERVTHLAIKHECREKW